MSFPIFVKPAGTNSHKGFTAPSSYTSRNKPSYPEQFSCFFCVEGALRKENTGTKCECEPKATRINES